MTSTILVWFLVTSGGYNSNNIVYSPPIATERDCEHLRKNLPVSEYHSHRGRCIQVAVPVMAVPMVAGPSKSSNSK